MQRRCEQQFEYHTRVRAIADVRVYIDKRFAEPLTIDRLALIAGLSPFHFIRAFRTEVGQTPHQYVRQRRIDRACELLVTTPLSVTDICDATGFQSLGSFSSLFKRVVGETPAQYRARRRRDVYIPGCFVRMYRVER
jgi:AraC-like DNA-binding protein